jgi:methylmalonyl-CoA mutase
MSAKPKILSEFDAVPFEKWKAKAEIDLKGAPFEKKLVTKTYEGIDIQPLYVAEDVKDLEHLKANPGVGQFSRGFREEGYVAEGWKIAQAMSYPTAAEFNAAVASDLARGLSAVSLGLDGASRKGQDADIAADGVGCCGTSISTLQDLESALKGVDLEKTPVFVRPGASGVAVAAFLASVVKARKQDLKKVSGAIENDPVGELAGCGGLSQSLDEAYDELAQVTAWAASEAPKLSIATVHARNVLEAGGSAVQELAFALAVGAEYLRELQKRGVAVDTAAPRMRFAFGVGSNFFVEIAKFRAARLLWSRVVEAFGGSEASRALNIHARTALWNKSKLDLHANLLRTTTESFSAVLGGVQSLETQPFDEVLGLPDEFSRRIARNQQVLLATEAHLRRVVDPAGGSWAVEWLTDKVAGKAWELFQAIEGKGGASAALKDGFFQAEVEKVAKARESALAGRKDVQVGVNQYANLKEKKVEARVPDFASIGKARKAELGAWRAAHSGAKAAVAKIAKDKLVASAIEAVAAGATLGEISGAIHSGSARVAGLNRHRLSDAFEALREASEKHLARTGSRPKVFLATMGPLLQHKARGDFSRGFFEVGGFEVVYPKGFDTPAAAVEAAKASGAKAVVICSTDDTYPEIVPQVAPALKAAIPGVTVVLAGYPTDQIEAHKASGVDDFIHVRANLLAVLGGLQKKIGVVA